MKNQNIKNENMNSESTKDEIKRNMPMKNVIIKKDEKKKEWQELEDIAVRILEQTKKMGATGAEVALSLESGLSATVRMAGVETIEFNHDKSLGLTLYRGKRKGSVSTTDLSHDALKNLVEKAYRIAEYTEEDAAAGLPDKENLAINFLDLALNHPWEVDAEDAIRFAKECEETALAFDPRIFNSEGATFATHNHFRVYANSDGFLGSYPSTRHSLNCIVVGKQKDSMQRDYDYTIARDSKDLDPGKKIGRSAAERTIQRLGARKIKTCKSPVLFSAEIATTLFNHFISAISGGNLYRKTSFLLDNLEKKVFPNFMNIEEKPHILKALGSAPFDQEGVANYEHDIVREGLLKSYVLSTYSSRRLGLKTTGNCGGIHNLVVNSGNTERLSLDDLLKKMDTGLLVTSLMGHGINIVTGDYSRGASGFWVEKGQIQYPVEEITIAANLKDMFLNIVAVGNDIERRGNIFTGSVLIENMIIAGE